MKEKLLQFGKHSMIYGISSALTAIGAFLLIPLYTHLLKPSEYGILELLNRTSDILMLIILMGMIQSFFRFYFDHKSEKWRKQLIATVTIFLLFSSIFITFIVFLLRNYLAEILFNNTKLGIYFVFILIWIPFEILFKLGMAHLQIQLKSINYVIISLLKFLFIIGSNFVLLYYFRLGIIGILITNLWISALIGSIFLINTIKWTKLNFNLSILKDLIKFGLPFIPASIFSFIISHGDKYFLSAYSTLNEVGIYSLGYKFGMFGTALVMEPFQKVWLPFLFENYNKEDGQLLISKVFTIFVLITISVGLMIAISMPILIPLISDKAYYNASKIVPILTLAATFYGMALIADAGILISKKTIYKPLIFGLAAFISIISFRVFIPNFGAKGAAISVAINFFSLFIINYFISSNFYKLTIEYRKMGLIFIMAFITYFCSSFILDYISGDLLPKIFSLFVFILFPVLLYISGFFSKEEKLIFKKLFNNK